MFERYRFPRVLLPHERVEVPARALKEPCLVCVFFVDIFIRRGTGASVLRVCPVHDEEMADKKRMFTGTLTVP